MPLPDSLGPDLIGQLNMVREGWSATQLHNLIVIWGMDCRSNGWHPLPSNACLGGMVDGDEEDDSSHEPDGLERSRDAHVEELSNTCCC